MERINSMPVISCHKPQATYLLYVDISGLGVPSAQFTDYLIEHAGLALVPGGETFFGPGSEGAMRICFATSREILEEGLNRLETGLKMFLEEKK